MVEIKISFKPTAARPHGYAPPTDVLTDDSRIESYSGSVVFGRRSAEAPLSGTICFVYPWWCIERFEARYVEPDSTEAAA